MFLLLLSCLRTWLVSMRMWIWSLALLSRLKTWHCHKLRWRSQIHLGSIVAVALDNTSAAAPIRSLAWDLPYALGVALTKWKGKHISLWDWDMCDFHKRNLKMELACNSHPKPVISLGLLSGKKERYPLTQAIYLCLQSFSYCTYFTNSYLGAQVCKLLCYLLQKTETLYIVI